MRTYLDIFPLLLLCAQCSEYPAVHYSGRHCLVIESWGSKINYIYSLISNNLFINKIMVFDGASPAQVALSSTFEAFNSIASGFDTCMKSASNKCYGWSPPSCWACMSADLRDSWSNHPFRSLWNHLRPWTWMNTFACLHVETYSIDTLLLLRWTQQVDSPRMWTCLRQQDWW